jgi:hypothetical protein
MYSRRRPIHPVFLSLAFAATFLSPCPAQEVASLDLTKVEVRLGFRRPQPTSPGPHGGGAQEMRQCPDKTHNAGGLRATLLSLDRTHYQVGDEPRFEVIVENAGSAPIKVPFSPHLADLQPQDPAQEFGYQELQIELWIEAGEQWSANGGGSAILYGAADHANTMVTLNPGESVRIIAKGHFRLDDYPLKLTLAGNPVDQVNAQASLFRAKTLITPTQSATSIQEVCIAKTQGQSVPIELSIP